MQIRTFVALEVPDEPKQQLAEYIEVWKRSFPKGINWVKPENLHMTLLFIGDSESSLVPKMSKNIGKACESLEPIAMNILGLELFPSINPRLLWAKLDTEDKSIFKLPNALMHQLQSFGLEPETKPLKLHITMGRIKAPQPNWVEREFLQANVSSDSYHYDTVTFYKSTHGKDGPVYTILEQYVL